RLQRFEHFIESDLVTQDDFRPYLRYWLTLLGQPSSARKPVAVLHGIWRYIDYYQYNDVQTFFKRYGFDITRFAEYSADLIDIDTPQVVIEEDDLSGTVTRAGFGTLAQGRSVGG
ncbi:MAG TPA: hypothetical protein VEY93_16400, partial [Longimicrobium sp.]|nr:hypothetical protein [Longimicrobium sp.]